MSASFSRPLFLLAVWIVAGAAFAAAATHKQSASSGINPEAFRSAIVVDAATGKVLFEDRADVQSPPASVTKLMTFYIVEEKIRAGELKLDTPVTVSAEASHTGGSRVWLVDKEQIPVEELLYALMVPSANDAAVALATQVSGSKAAFVDLMNIKAKEIGMNNTIFRSPHGLPPDVRKGQEPDLSTARDIATLARKLVAETDILKYSSTRHRPFKHQNGKVIEMDNHNHLLGSVPGCDGLKTGYYREAGFSLASTVQRNGRRIIAVVLGSPAGQGSHQWELRDTVTTQLIERGFAALPPPVTPAATAGAAGAAALPASAAVPAPAGTSTAATPSTTPAAPTPAPATDASAPQLIPVGTEAPKAPADAKASPDATVHLVIPGTKK
jgi:D-alanyl-D-alanine carboxypeptidase (penicillin-binding protein 5/6)